MRKTWVATAIITVLFVLSVSGSYNIAYGNPEDIKKDVEQTKAEVAELEKTVKALEEYIKTRVERIEELDKEFLDTEKKLEQAIREISLSEVRLKEKNQAFAGRVRGAYMKGGVSYMEVLLAAENLGDLIVRLGYLTRILSRDAALITTIRQEQAVLQEWTASLDERQQNLQDLRYQNEAERRNLEDLRREKEALLIATRKKLSGELARITPQAARKPVYGVAMDNAPQARPQHGLAEASVVYEYEVEGQITRYLALFSSFPTKVGPIRSARTHSIMLAMENDVNFLFASAGWDVLDQIKEWKTKSTNVVTSRSSSFYRDSSRKAPHNLYVNLSTLNLESPSQVVVVRPAYLSRQGTPATSVSLEYSANYRVGYTYLANQGAYRRQINGNIHKDASGKVIMARNVIIQYVPHALDFRLRPTPDIIGEGAIDFYSQGEHFKGIWKKDSIFSPTRFYYQDGQEIERVYGQTWIQLARDK
jgi:peptidoglycan hydrolase CwlO-like protein